ncbi:hypothetical protein SPAN111604_09525 [Sphingomonas antarctica]
MSISQSRLEALGVAIAALGWAANTGELVSIFVALPIIILPADAIGITVTDDHNQTYQLS